MTRHLVSSLRRIPLGPCAVAALTLGCAAAQGRAPAERDVRVLVYNVHAGKDAAGRDNAERVADVVKLARADVVLLQEVDRGTRRSAGVDQPADYARRTGLHAAFGRSLDYDGGEYGIALLSRWPIRRDTAIHLVVTPPQQRAGGSYEPRVAMVATIDAPSGALTVVNTHLDASGEDRWRRQEVRAIAEIVARLRETGARRLLVGGDFNSTPESAVQSDVRAAGLVDAWLACGRGDGLTYPADSSRKRIDYLFLTPGARCDSAIVLETNASDHRPVLFVVRLPP